MQIDPTQPCSTAFDYFTAEEKRHLEAFLKVGVDADLIFTNAAGGKRIVRRVMYPYGLQTKDTIYGRNIQEGSPYRYFHTPLASVSEHREAEVIFHDENGKSIKERSGAFLAWLGSGYVVEPVKDTNVPTKVPMKLIKALEEGTANFAEIDKARAEDKEEKPDWTPIKKRKKDSDKF